MRKLLIALAVLFGIVLPSPCCAVGELHQADVVFVSTNYLNECVEWYDSHIVNIDDGVYQVVNVEEECPQGVERGISNVGTSACYVSSGLASVIDMREGVYNYCPSVIYDGYGEYQVFYCSNSTSYSVCDDIWHVRLEKQDGYVYQYDSSSVLQPSQLGWDCFHVCDPSVVVGCFLYQGVSYKYLMAYLGCDNPDNRGNSVGFAVSNDFGSGWVKCQDINPVVSGTYEAWGAGQPSLVSLGGGDYMLFYTEGTASRTSTVVRYCQLSNLDNTIIGEPMMVSGAGTGDFLSNCDFARQDGYLYMVCDKHPFGGSTLRDVVSDSAPVFRTRFNGVEGLGSCVWEWVCCFDIGWTGFPKNHNCGLVRGYYGDLADTSVFVTTAEEFSTFADSLYSYRIRELRW